MTPLLQVAGVLLHHQLEGGNDLWVQLDADVVRAQDADLWQLHQPLIQRTTRLQAPP